MCFACCITKATDTPSEYVIIPAFPLQQLLRQGASVLSYTCIACLLCEYPNYEILQKSVLLGVVLFVHTDGLTCGEVNLRFSHLHYERAY